MDGNAGFISGQGGTYDPNIASNVANEEENFAQQNNNYWQDVYNKWNPQQQFMQTPSTAGGFQNIANQAKGISNQSSGTGIGNSMFNPNFQGQKMDTSGEQTSKSVDLDTFLKNQKTNQGLSNQRLESMFGGSQNVGRAENEMSYQQPQDRALSNAETQQQIENDWNKYYQSQPNVGNMIAGGIGKLGGVLAGKGLISLFKQTPQTPQVPNDDWQNELPQ